jgi:hypothetical protein
MKNILGTTKLLTTNAKIDKSIKFFNNEYEATILQMIPGKGVCVDYSRCLSKCLAFTGFAKIWKSVNVARQKRKDLFVDNIDLFKTYILKEINNQVKRAAKKNRVAVIRLNGFTDINWALILFNGKTLFELFPDVIFYDYTADFDKAKNNRIANYHLTFSFKSDKHGNNSAACHEMIRRGMSVAVIDTPENRDKWFNGLPGINGDQHDFRFLDNDSSIVWLTFKK